MKTIGLIGGMSWESTAIYYKEINTATKRRLGGLNSATILMSSLNFARIAELQKQAQWERMGLLLVDEAQKLERAGADFILICSNTMHKVANQVSEQISAPLLHIVDGVGEKILADKVQKVALLGTQFTMEQPFYKDRLSKQCAIEVVIPTASQRTDIHRIIFEELCLGQCLAESKARYLAIIKSLHAKGVKGIILGCTEIGLLITQEDLIEAGLDVQLYDTTLIHAEMAVEKACG